MTKRSDGWYVETIMTDGKRKYFYGKTKQEVHKKMFEYRQETEKGVSFRKAADEWRTEIEPTLAVRSWKYAYQPAWERAKEHFKGAVKDITPMDVQLFMEKYVKKNNASQKSASTQLQVVRQILSYSVVHGYAQVNVARELKAPKTKPKKKVSVPTSAELDIVKQYDEDVAARIAFWSLYTGLRKGELLGLTWNDVDLKKRIITVRQSVYYNGNKGALKDPKTAAGTRKVPIVDKLYEKIEKPGKGYVFPGKDGLMSSSEYRHHWEGFCKRNGIDCNLHQFRHAFATMMFEAGIEAKDAMEILGHAQYTTTMAIYTDIRESRRDITKEKILKLDIS